MEENCPPLVFGVKFILFQLAATFGVRPNIRGMAWRGVAWRGVDRGVDVEKCSNHQALANIQSSSAYQYSVCTQ